MRDPPDRFPERPLCGFHPGFAPRFSSDKAADQYEYKDDVENREDEFAHPDTCETKDRKPENRTYKGEDREKDSPVKRIILLSPNRTGSSGRFENPNTAEPSSRPGRKK
jgi:hypothetical protein